MKRVSTNSITFSCILTAGKRALINKWKKLGSNSLIADDRSSKRIETSINSSMQHSICEDLSYEAPRGANNGQFGTDPNSNFSVPFC